MIVITIWNIWIIILVNKFYNDDPDDFTYDDLADGKFTWRH